MVININGFEIEEYAYYCTNCGCTKLMLPFQVYENCPICNKCKLKETPHEYELTFSLYKSDEAQYNRNEQRFHREVIDDSKANKIIYEQERSQKIAEEKLKEIQKKQKNSPKCPNCNSTNVHPISGLKRLTSVGLFGLASSTIGKTYECLLCKYKW